MLQSNKNFVVCQYLNLIQLNELQCCNFNLE